MRIVNLKYKTKISLEKYDNEEIELDCVLSEQDNVEECIATCRKMTRGNIPYKPFNQEEETLVKASNPAPLVKSKEVENNEKPSISNNTNAPRNLVNNLVSDAVAPKLAETETPRGRGRPPKLAPAVIDEVILPKPEIKKEEIKKEEVVAPVKQEIVKQEIVKQETKKEEVTFSKVVSEEKAEEIVLPKEEPKIEEPKAKEDVDPLTNDDNTPESIYNEIKTLFKMALEDPTIPMPAYVKPRNELSIEDILDATYQEGYSTYDKMEASHKELVRNLLSSILNEKWENPAIRKFAGNALAEIHEIEWFIDEYDQILPSFQRCLWTVFFNQEPKLSL